MLEPVKALMLQLLAVPPEPSLPAGSAATTRVFRASRRYVVPSKAMVRVDINPNNVLGREYPQTFITGDVRPLLGWLQSNRADYHDALKATSAARQGWLGSIRGTPYYDTDADRTSDAVPMNPARVVAELRRAAPRDTVLVVDSGAHTFFMAHHWTSYAPNEFLMLSTTGPMGYGVAMAIGAKLARPAQPHCAMVGDGSLLMHGMEIHTAVRYGLAIVITVINNSALGNVYLRALHEGPEAVRLAENPTQDWAAFSRSFHFPGLNPGDKWCLCALRWKEALDAGVAPPVVLAATHEKALEFVSPADLKRHAVDLH